MQTTIMINDMAIEAFNVKLDTITEKERERTRVNFSFHVTHDTYHDITTLLYQNDFTIKMPEKDLAFPAVITTYSTSITNLYEPGNVGEFKLELTEK
ncbi:YkvR family protein [Barrientosiimonas marina]|uniref:DUF3219 family protein n=1 Tax=Lentibacillus kimchii TaxID=1542911 RepID=A0ABW2US96_9BACI